MSMKRNRAAGFAVKETGDDGTFAGYGSVFGTIDSYRERIAPGAFKASLKAHKQAGTMPSLLWQHDARQPIGVYTSMREDDHGLYVEGQLAMDTQQGREAHSLLKLGALNGLSIGFMTGEANEGDDGIVTLTEVDLWETSLVTFPANTDARVTAVRAMLDDGEMPSPKDLERALREVGFSNSQAKAIVAAGHKGLVTPRDADSGAAELRALARMFNPSS